MNKLVMMTGPHLGAVAAGEKGKRTWKVAVISAADAAPCGKTYHCLSYRRAVSLSCRMAKDRRLRLHVEALPP